MSLVILGVNWAKALLKFVVPLYKDTLPQLATKATSSFIHERNIRKKYMGLKEP